MERKGSIVWGVFFILLGVLLVLDRAFNFNFVSFTTLWPLFVLVPGLMFEFSYFVSRRDPGLLVPGGILTTIGALFLFETATRWRFSEYTWPIYPLAVAIGLYQLYVFGGRERGLLIPVFILGGFSVISLAATLMNTEIFALLIPAVLIAIGAYIIINGKKPQ